MIGRFKELLNKSIEAFDERILVPMSWDSLFINYIIGLWESEDYSENKIIEYGKLMGIKNVKAILEKRIEIEGNKLNYFEWEKSLIKIIDNME